MNEGNFFQRRTVERIPCFLTGDYILPDSTLNNVRCEDISTKGTAVVTLRALPVDGNVKIEVDTRADQPISFEGKVLWCKRGLNGWRSGIFFDNDLLLDIKKIK